MVVSPDGKYVFASADGSLAIVDNQTAAGLIKTPRDFAIDPTGKFLVVANQDASNVVVLQVGSDGRMTLKGAATTVPNSPSFVGIIKLP